MSFQFHLPICCLLRSICEHPLQGIVWHYKKAQLSAGIGHRIKHDLLAKGLIIQTEIKNKKGKILLLRLTKKGATHLRLQTEKPIAQSVAGSEHQYYQDKIATALEKKKDIESRKNQKLDMHVQTYL